MAWGSRLAARRQDRSRPGRGLRVGVLGCVVSALVLGIGHSCISPDPEYCETRATCPYADTPMGPMQLFCHSTRHVCLLTGEGVCVKDEDCPVARPHCNVDTNACLPCTVGDASDTSCARFLDRPLCGVASDGSGTTLCLACRNNLDCPSATPICDNQQCRKCAEHSDCEGELNCDDGNKCTDSMVCIGDGEVTPERAGSCAKNGPSGRVVYVNNLDAICPATPSVIPLPTPYGDQFATPQCNLDQGLAVAKQGRQFIRVVGKDLSAGLNLADGATYSVIGAARKSATNPDLATMATFSLRGSAFMLSGTGALTLDQLDITERNTDPTVVIDCSGSTTSAVPRLTLRRSILRGSVPPTALPNTLVKAAVRLNNCTTLLDRNVIGVSKVAELTTASAHAQGISIVDSHRDDAATSYLIQNNLIAGNIGAAMNLMGTTGATPHFVIRFNSLIGNGRNTPTTSGAVLCDALASTQEFSHSLVVLNSLSAAPNNSQFLSPSSCGVKDVVVGTTEGSPLQLPEFIHTAAPVAYDAQFRLLPTSLPCIDQVTAGSGEILPATDIDGRKRPQGAKWDIGAAELKQ